MTPQDTTTRNHPNPALFLDLTRQIARQITTNLNLDELLTSLVSLVQQELNYYFVGVWLLTESQDVVTLKAAAGSEAQLSIKPAYHLPLSDQGGIISWVYRTEQAYLANDVTQDQHYLTLPNLPKTCAEFGLPLFFGREMLGVLDIHSDQIGYFGETEWTFLATLADQLATAIQSAHLRAAVDKTAATRVGWDRIFYRVAHDLKEPFQPLLGFSKLLLRTADKATPAQLREMGAGIHRSAQNIYSFLDDLLLWSKIRMGQLEYDPASLDLSETVNRLLESRLAQAQDKQISLRHTITTPLWVTADQPMLETIIVNLISNALKFTPTGGNITISAQQIESVFSKTGVGLIEVSVADNGVGISPENMAKLFQAETRHTTLGTAKEQGAGLGLIICKALVETQYGQIRLESEVNKGTTVRFTLPMTVSS